MKESVNLQRLKRFVWAGMAVFMAAVVLVSGWVVWKERQDALAGGEVQTQQFLSGAETALNRSLFAVDVLLSSMDEILGMSQVSAGSLAQDDVSVRLHGAVRQNTLVRRAVLIDPQGQVVASSDVAGRSLVQALPPDFLQAALVQTVSMLIVSSPVASLSDGLQSEQVLYLARSLPLADQSRVVVVAEVPLQALGYLLAQGAPQHELQVTLESTDGLLLASLPARPQAGDDVPVTNMMPLVVPASSPPRRMESPLQAYPGQGDGWTSAARITGEPALVMHRPVLYPDLHLSASLPLASALGKWREQRAAIALTALLFMAMILVTGDLALRYLERLSQARLTIDQSKATLDQALESMISGFLLLDKDQRVVRWNRRFEEIFPWLRGCMQPGVPFRSVIEETSYHHLPMASDDERRQWVERRMLKQQNPDPHEQLHPSGNALQINERPTPEGGFVITYHDVTELRKASAEIESLAFYDPLTNLPNRRLLMDRMQQASAASARSGHYGALLFLDLDHFKHLNDTLGHKVGDQLLCQVAQRLSTCVRSEDTVARLGGDEFVVLLHDLSVQREEAAELARRVGEKILQHLNQPYTLGLHVHRSSVSIGISMMGSGQEGQEAMADWLKQADIAMYQVKSQGRDALCFFDPEMQVAITARARLEGDMKIALVAQQFVLHYQPQYHLDGRMVGAEALIRWQHPERGLLTPAAFISVAEESELIVPVGHWALRTACAQLALWQDDPRYRHVQVSVNVSARQFRHFNFVNQVIEVLRETGARPHLLKLELTESVVLDNVDETVAKMGLLKTKGVRFSVDDFGTGYSSLAYLTRLPLDQLKIDRSFVSHLGQRHSDDVIVQTIIGMARNLELDVIAEGVETPLQRDLLAAYGCHFFQGFLLGKPLPVADLERLVQEAGPPAGLGSVAAAEGHGAVASGAD
jgi:diguanylate cyclase (GGDEF)-like protein